MFDFLNMADNYEQKKIINTIIHNMLIDIIVCTTEISDSNKPYETGIKCSEYNDNWIIVELYDTQKDAELGHKRWVKKFSGKKLPSSLTGKKLPSSPSLTDTNECTLEDFANSFDHTFHNTYKRKAVKKLIKGAS